MNRKVAIVVSIILFSWCALLAYWYTCRIKGLCSVREVVEKKSVIYVPIEPEKAPAPPPLIPTVYFLLNKDTVKNVDDLIEGTKKISEYLDKNANKKVYLDGYASSEESYKVALVRMDTVKQYLVSHGVAENKVIIESNQKADTDNMENRRVEVVIR